MAAQTLATLCKSARLMYNLQPRNYNSGVLSALGGWAGGDSLLGRDSTGPVLVAYTVSCIVCL